MSPLHENEARILKLLKGSRVAGLDAIEKDLGIDADSALLALENLAESGAVRLSKIKAYDVSLTEEGKRYLKSFPEEELIKSLSGKKQERLSDIKNTVGLIWAKRNGWIETENGNARLTKAGEDAASGGADYAQRVLLNRIVHPGKEGIASVVDNNKSVVDNLIKRGLIMLRERNRVSGIDITDAGLKLSGAKTEEGIGALTRGMITSRGWAGKDFKGYDVNASSDVIYPARQHVMHEFIDVVRDIWLRMGFSEVEGPIVESAFWNFDALFEPQDHPSREMQDTFFLSNPKQIDIEDLELLDKVKKMHEKGWKEEWRAEVAKQALLRTQTTAVSARYINKFANAIESSYPLRLFSIGKVFRNESIDYKHLAELHQTDGIVIGNNLALSNLIETLKRFFSQLGIEARARPSYFPFVEPGLEMYYYDEKRGSITELGGAGIIRKEITKAMGTNKTVLAWGIGIERMLMRSIGVDLITDLYRNDIGWLNNRPELKI